jgi:hypothetical protein
MEYVNKKIAEIAKEKGFNEPCIRNIWGNNNTVSFSDGLVQQDDWSITNMRLNTPTYQQLIEWIFSHDKAGNVKDRHTFPSSYLTCLIENIEWLENWYNILIAELNEENKFVLNGFIGMLSDWFEENDVKLVILPKIPTHYSCNILHKLNKKGFEYTNEFNTKQQAINAGILKCFELMKRQ